jgi:hypothetical protein
MEKKVATIVLCFMFVGFGLSAAIRAEDLGTVFSYQGRLETAGSPPLNGSYDFKFQVYDTPIVGTGTPIGDPMAEPNVPVTEGIFTVQLDPDPNGTDPNLFNGEVRYLEIAVRKTGSAEQYYTISPRQRINAAPYAITASSARWLRGRSSTEKVVYVDDAGNVGVGTTSPTAKLEVNGNIKTAGIYEDGSGNLGIGTMSPSQKLEIVGSATVSGNVGIGTTSPTRELDVNGTVKADSFNGMPWRSPVWFMVDANPGDIARLAAVAWDNHYLGRYYRIPYNVKIDGAVVSVTDDGPTAYVSIELWTGTNLDYLSKKRTTYTANFDDSYDSKIVTFVGGPCTVSANSLMGAICATGNDPEVFIFFYGRIME